MGKDLTSAEASKLARQHEAKLAAEQDRQLQDLRTRARATLRAVERAV